jgi:squalene-hopene/tetraprenyl-beta-curcumene cyclase
LGGESEQRVSGFAGGRAMNNMNGLDNFNGLNNLQQQRGAVEPAVNVPAETSGGLGIPSNAFGTGQTLYTLRLLGRTDGDAAIRRGTEWLIKNQKENGGWSEGGFGKAEAMWGVLGLVSIDVLTVSVDGLKDGQHVSQLMAIKADAKDNQGGGVVKVEATVDDIPAYGACGAKMDWKFDTSVLTEGKHVIDIKATNAKGEVSVRRFEVYAGNVFLTQMGNRFTGSGTEVSVRNIAPAEQKSRVRLEVYEVKTENGVDKPAERVKAIEQDGKQGAMNFFWDGKDDKGAPKNEGKYVAKVSFLDDKGKVIQTVDQPFIHASAEYQMNNFGQIQGQIALPNEAAAGNVELELVDDLGNVVQKTWSTQSGQYRFRNVDDGKKYQIRAKKAGFSAAAPVAPARAEENKADLKLIAE